MEPPTIPIGTSITGVAPLSLMAGGSGQCSAAGATTAEPGRRTALSSVLDEGNIMKSDGISIRVGFRIQEIGDEP